MGILGLRIISSSGIPIFNKVWSEKLAGFESEDQSLQAGFMTAILSFAKSMRHEVGFIRFYSLEENEEKSTNIDLERMYYGIDALISLRDDEILFILFLEPYIFKSAIELKIGWIYEYIIKKYKHNIKKGENLKFSDEENKNIEDILFDRRAREYISKKKKKIKKIIKKDIIKEFPHEKILGFAICSFDNSILCTQGIELEELEMYLNNMGLLTKIKEWECQYKPIWIPDREPVLVSVINSAMQVPVLSSIDNDSKVPYFYYLVTDQDALLGPLTEKILGKINNFFLDQ
jgi:hypothetical protein